MQGGETKIIPAHGGYRDLKSYQNTVIIYDFTVAFCKKYIDRFSRTKEQMTQAARSGKQNIAEGSTVSGTSKKSEIKLISIARGSLEELLQDYEDFLRQNKKQIWRKDDPRSKKLRKLSYKQDKSFRTYEPCLKHPELAGNTMICLINQTNYLLDKQIKALDNDFLEQGGFTERLYKARKKHRGY